MIVWSTSNNARVLLVWFFLLFFTHLINVKRPKKSRKNQAKIFCLYCSSITLKIFKGVGSLSGVIVKILRLLNPVIEREHYRTACLYVNLRPSVVLKNFHQKTSLKPITLDEIRNIYYIVLCLNYSNHRKSPRTCIFILFSQKETALLCLNRTLSLYQN